MVSYVVSRCVQRNAIGLRLRYRTRSESPKYVRRPFWLNTSTERSTRRLLRRARAIRSASTRCLSELEHGKVRLDAEELIQIAAILGKDLAYFYAAPEAPSIVYRRGDRGLTADQQRETSKAIEAFKQYAREQTKLSAKKQGK